MPKRDMKTALGSSMRAEERAVVDRFAVAESVMARGDAPSPAAPSVSSKPSVDATPKVVRDSFTMPTSDYEQIALVRERCLEHGTSATKAEVLRAALALLVSLSDEELVRRVRALPKVRIGRPAGTGDMV
jgi:hypothetical protein